MDEHIDMSDFRKDSFEDYSCRWDSIVADKTMFESAIDKLRKRNGYIDGMGPPVYGGPTWEERNSVEKAREALKMIKAKEELLKKIGPLTPPSIWDDVMSFELKF